MNTYFRIKVALSAHSTSTNNVITSYPRWFVIYLSFCPEPDGINLWLYQYISYTVNTGNSAEYITIIDN